MTPETRLKTRVLEALRALPRSWWYKVPGSVYGRRGTPDILGCWDGRFVALELKAPKGRVTALQRATLDDIRGAGGFAAVVSGNDGWRAVFKEMRDGWCYSDGRP